jgi:cytochrome c oxidase subunit II
MALAIALILIVIIAVVFQIVTPWWSTPVASNWSNIDDILIITGLITGAVFIAVNLFIALAIFRFRHKEGRRAHYQPENKKLEWSLIGATTVGIIAMLAPGLFVYSDFVNVPDDAKSFEVVAQQWQWSFRFPGDDGQLGTVDTRYISTSNPFGINPDDEAGQDDRLVMSNEVHLPLHKPVKVLLRSKDVLHDFYVPHFRVKMDMIPGQVSYLWFSPTRPGKFEVLCAEYCGLGHYNMRGYVIVEEEADYAKWLQQLPTFASLNSTGTLASHPSDQDPVAAGKALAQVHGCMGCHSTDGSSAVGPSWKDLYGKQETLADDTQVLADSDYLKRAITHPNDELVKGYSPIMPAYNLDDQQLEILVAYIASLSNETGATP